MIVFPNIHSKYIGIHSVQNKIYNPAKKIENPKDIIRKLLESISEFSKVTGYKINLYTEIICIPIY